MTGMRKNWFAAISALTVAGAGKPGPMATTNPHAGKYLWCSSDPYATLELAMNAARAEWHRRQIDASPPIASGDRIMTPTVTAKDLGSGFPHDIQTPDPVAVAKASGLPEAWELLDRQIRGRLLTLVGRGGDPAGAGALLARACDAAPEPWVTRWAWGLELLRDARECPGIAGDLKALMEIRRGREVLIAFDKLLLLREVQSRLRIEHPDSLLAPLVAAGFIHPYRGEDTAMVFTLTTRGKELRAVLTGDPEDARPLRWFAAIGTSGGATPSPRPMAARLPLPGMSWCSLASYDSAALAVDAARAELCRRQIEAGVE